MRTRASCEEVEAVVRAALELVLAHERRYGPARFATLSEEYALSAVRSAMTELDESLARTNSAEAQNSQGQEPS